MNLKRNIFLRPFLRFTISCLHYWIFFNYFLFSLYYDKALKQYHMHYELGFQIISGDWILWN